MMRRKNNASPESVRPRLGGPATTHAPTDAEPEQDSPQRSRWFRGRRDTNAESVERAPAATSSDQVGARLATATIRVGLVGCLVCGPVAALGLGWVAVNPTQVSAIAVPKVREPADVAFAGEMASRVVVAWLGATREDSEGLFALTNQAELSALPEEGQRVASVRVASVSEEGSVFSVVVGATVTAVKGDPQRRFFQVPVRVDGDMVAALSLPAPVTGPVIAASPKLGYREQLSSDELVSTTVEQFLGAYLTGVGDVSRYLTPQTTIAPIAPSLFVQVVVDDITGDRALDPEVAPADGDSVRVLVTATGTVTETQSSTVSYALSLSARAGRWEVAAIDATPLLAGDSSGGSLPVPDRSIDSTQSTTTP